MKKFKSAKSRADYMRDYRKTVKTIDLRGERQAGIREGIALVVTYLRETIAGKAFTGYQLAVTVERAMLASETPEVAQRRALVDSLR